MKVWQSKLNQQTGQRHLVLDMTRDEEAEAFWVLRHQVIGHRGMAPKRRVMPDGTVRYRFRSRHLQRLVSTFPFAELSPGLDRKLRRAQAVDLSDVEVPELDIPDFGAELYDFQKIGVKAILDHDRFMLNDEMGLGKTVMALAAIVASCSVPALVVCPNSAKWVWERMADQFTELDCLVADGSTERRKAIIRAGAEITVINVEMLQKTDIVELLKQITYERGVVDEFHRFKSHSAQQTKGFMELQADKWLLMSGTPILNRVEEAWTGLHRLFPTRFPNYYAFEKWMCIKRQIEKHERITDPNTGRSRVKTKKYTKVVGYNPDAFAKLKKFVHENSMRRRKDQVLTDLPEVIYSTVLTELTPEQRRLYNQVTNEMKLALADGTIRDVRGMLAVVTRTKQICFSPELYGGSPVSQKLTELKEVVRQLTDSGEKAIIFSQWAKACNIIRRELQGYGIAYVTGKVKGKRRQDEVDKFNDDEECQLYIGTIGANREAITLSAATYVIFTDKDWVPMYNDQAVARSAAGGLRGVGVTSAVNVIELFARDTVEERIEAVLGEKRNTFNAFVEEDGGAVVERLTVAQLRDLF